ncbi:hypothetical protein IWW54_006233, partial [Coemansia sp. RSA 2705]
PAPGGGRVRARQGVGGAAGALPPVPAQPRVDAAGHAQAQVRQSVPLPRGLPADLRAL